MGVQSPFLRLRSSLAVVPALFQNQSFRFLHRHPHARRLIGSYEIQREDSI
jgi:hypothetical protein